MHAETTIRFPAALTLRVPADLPAALRRAAARNHTNPAEWARQRLIRALADEGISLDAAMEARA